MLRDLVHSYAALLLRIDVEQRGEVPGYRLSLTVGFGGEQRTFARGGGALQRLYKVRFAAHLDVFRFKVVFDVDRETALRQIPYMPDARKHLVAGAKYLFKRLGLRGRLHDHKRLAVILGKFLAAGGFCSALFRWGLLFSRRAGASFSGLCRFSRFFHSFSLSRLFDR